MSTPEAVAVALLTAAHASGPTGTRRRSSWSGPAPTPGVTPFRRTEQAILQVLDVGPDGSRW